MSTFSGSYVTTSAHSNDRINAIVDNLLTPRMLMFRQVLVFDEQAVLQSDNETWRVTYGSWNSTYPLIVRKNGQKLPSGSYSDVDYIMGTFKAGTVSSGDWVTVSYCFDYFPIGVLAGFIVQSVDTINSAAYGPPTDYTITSAPGHWDSVIADLAFALSMERLILDYDLWVGRLIFAIPSIEDGGDIVSQLETLKRNSEDRAYKSLENERFKVSNCLSTPTSFYYAGIRGFGRSGVHAQGGYGKLRGWHPNKYL